MSARAAKPIPGLVLGAEPRAHLLPPEVSERGKAKRTRGVLIFLVVLVLLLTGAAYGLVSVQAIQAQAALAASQAHTLELIEQRAQYTETVAVTRSRDVISEVRINATSNEVIWADILDKISAQLSPNSYAEWLAQGTTPWASQLGAAGPLRESRVASLTLVVTSPVPFDATALFLAIQRLPEIADVTLDDITQPSGALTYDATFTINLSEEALSGRWVAETEETADDTTESTTEETEGADDEG